MGKGAGGCDDRPAFAMSAAIADMPDNVPDISPSDAWEMEVEQRLQAHRAMYPGNEMLGFGSPYPAGEDSDRVRFRKMIKHLQGKGYVVSTWEKRVDDANIEFEFDEDPPYWNGSGDFKEYLQMDIMVTDTTEDGSPDEAYQTTMNDLQSALQQYGFFAVVSMNHNIRQIGKIAGAAQLWNADVEVDPLHAIVTECNGDATRMASTQEEELLSTEEGQLRYASFLLSPALAPIGAHSITHWAHDEAVSLDEAETWVAAGITQRPNAQQWAQAGFDPATAEKWLASGIWREHQGDVAGEFYQAEISLPQAAFLQEINADPAYVDELNDEQWQRCIDTRDNFMDNGSNQRTFANRMLQRAIKEFTQGSSTKEEFERDLDWINAGFPLWGSYYSSFKREPWNGEWQGNTAEEAHAYIKAGFTEKIDGLNAQSLQAVTQWQASYGEDPPAGPVAFRLIKAGVDVNDYQAVVGMVGTQRTATEILESGKWDMNSIKEWSSVLQSYYVSYKREEIQQFRSLGATPQQATAFIEENIDPSAFTKIQALFTQSA